MTSVTTEASTLLDEAKTAPSGRAARALVGGSGRALRQTLIAILSGRELANHDNPGEATVQVLFGRVELHADGHSQHGGAGELLVVPDARHGLRALDDTVVLLTVSRRPDNETASAPAARTSALTATATPSVT
jgi:quercetin dioxygenase-like cupin family protein